MLYISRNRKLNFFSYLIKEKRRTYYKMHCLTYVLCNWHWVKLFRTNIYDWQYDAEYGCTEEINM